MARTTRAIRARKPDQGIFYNSRLRMEWEPELGNRPEMDDFTHLEIERMYSSASLPGGSWGYDHFPMYVRYLDLWPRSCGHDRPLPHFVGRLWRAAQSGRMGTSGAGQLQEF